MADPAVPSQIQHAFSAPSSLFPRHPPLTKTFSVPPKPTPSLLHPLTALSEEATSSGSGNGGSDAQSAVSQDIGRGTGGSGSGGSEGGGGEEQGDSSGSEGDGVEGLAALAEQQQLLEKIPVREDGLKLSPSAEWHLCSCSIAILSF